MGLADLAHLDRALLAAHDAGDRAALVVLYARAADHTSDPRTAAFYLTQAYVFALEAGAPEAAALRTRLVAMQAEDAA